MMARVARVALPGGAVLLAAACLLGPSGPDPGRAGTVTQLSAPGRCPTDRQVSLQFSGGLVGGVGCSTGRVACSPASGRGLQADIRLDSRGGPVQVRLQVGRAYQGPGSYALGTGSGDPASLVVSLEGSGTEWQAQPGGSLRVASDDDLGAAGLVSAELAARGGNRARVEGVWRCAR